MTRETLLSRGFTVLAVLCSGYFRVSGIGAPRSSKARRWVGVGMASRSDPDSLLPATRRWLRVRVAKWPSRAVKLVAGRCSVVVLDAALWLSLIHISEPTRLGMISYAVFCLK